MKRAIAGLLTAITILSGCADRGEAIASRAGSKNSTEGEGQAMSIELNERQKAILEKEGKPQVYSELDTTSKDAIVKIEGCYEHLDKTYPDVEFEYVTYYYTNPMHLVVYSKEDSLQRPVSVYVDYKDGEYIYSDTYMPAVVDSDKYAEEVKSFVLSKYPEAELFVYDELNTSDYIPGDDYIMRRASGTTTIVMANAFANEDEAKALLNDVLAWMKDNRDGVGERVYLNVYSSEDFRKTSIETYGREFRRETSAIYELEQKCSADNN